MGLTFQVVKIKIYETKNVHLLFSKYVKMNLEARKYYLIQELFKVKKESVIDALERVLKIEKEQYQEISKEDKEELDLRLESYKNNPNDILDWEDVMSEW